MMYPDLRPSVTGHYPPTISDVPPGVPVLGESLWGARGKGLIVGWVEPPADGVWRPESLLWTPPGTKALDLAGEIVDAQKFATVDTHLWVTSQLKLRDRWLEMMRQRVLSGVLKLNAELARMLGMEFGDGVALKGRDGNGADPQAEHARFLANVR